MRRALFALLVLLLAALPAPGEGDEQRETSCTKCHADADEFEDEDLEIVPDFSKGVHAEVGLSCHDCHGGNPAPGLADDEEAAMDEDYAENAYRGAPDATDIPGFCGRCHSDPVYMHRFRPEAQVDQEREYATSRHGVLLAQGDSKVATCVSCHEVHGIRRVSDPESPVYPTRVAETCSRCHSDAERMSGYELAAGTPLPTNQYSKWSRSVHARALLERGDFASATCNDCHGNHGAMPPEIGSIAFVCGQCHRRESELFRASPKYEGFAEHNEELADEPEGCAGCHEAPEPTAGSHARVLTECESCHGNHAIVRPSLAMFSSLPSSPCVFCHEPPQGVEVVPEHPAVRNGYEVVESKLVAEGRANGLAGTALFDWLVDQTLALSNHRAHGESGGIESAGREAEGASGLKPEFARLYDKFRIGKTYFTYVDLAAQREVREDVVRCTDCHAPEPVVSDEGVGFATAREFLNGIWQVTALTAQAERTLVAARRGGVATRDAPLEIDAAVDAQIELQALVHGFVAGDDTPFAAKRDEGLAHARAALAAGEQALQELGQRRRGLAVSLVAIALVALGLALKIRQLGWDGPAKE